MAPNGWKVGPSAVADPPQAATGGQGSAQIPLKPFDADGWSAAEAVRQYDWEVVADDILMVYETVAGSGATVSVGGIPTGGSAATREGA